MRLPIWAGLKRITTTGSYDPRIDGIRVLAILPVLLYHTSLRGFRVYSGENAATAHDTWLMSLVPRGDAGVMMFFVISGFIIAFPYLRASAGGKRAPGPGSFYYRRLTRLAPAYLLALTIAFVLLVASGYAPKDAPSFNRSAAPLWASYLASALYLHDVVLGEPSRIIPPAWSLEVEIQFYLIAPFLLAFYSRISTRLRRPLIFLATVVALIIGNMPEVRHGIDFPWRLTVFRFMHFFFAGIMLSDLMFAASDRRERLGDVALVVGFLCLCWASTWEPTWGYGDGVRDAVCLTSSVAALWGGLRGRALSQALAYAPVAIIGGACYSIYLTHVPIIQAWSEVTKRLSHSHSLVTELFLMGPAILIAVPVGLVFFVFVERPTMRPDWPTRLYERVIAPRLSASHQSRSA